MQVSDSEKAIARFLETLYGERPRTFILQENPDDPFFVGVAIKRDYPAAGMVTLATIGVSNHPLYNDDGTEYPDARVEFIASCRAGQEDDLEESLFLAARFVGKKKGFAHPGAFLRDLFGRFRQGTPVPHALLTTPFAYEGLGAVRDFGNRKVAWLQVVPASSAEIGYAQAHSTEALEELFEMKDIEWENLDRPSVIGVCDTCTITND